MAAPVRYTRRWFFVDEGAIRRARRVLGVQTNAEAVRLAVDRVTPAARPDVGDLAAKAATSCSHSSESASSHHPAADGLGISDTIAVENEKPAREL